MVFKHRCGSNSLKGTQRACFYHRHLLLWVILRWVLVNIKRMGYCALRAERWGHRKPPDA